jgi:hypothetical protein
VVSAIKTADTTSIGNIKTSPVSRYLRRGGAMIQEDKLKKVCDDFSLLNDEQQDYILGILQALVFAKTAYNQSEAGNSEAAFITEK